MFGSSLVSAYWNGAATYYRGIIRALHRCGFDATFRARCRREASPPEAQRPVRERVKSAERKRDSSRH